METLKQTEQKLLEDLRVEREQRLYHERQLRRQFNKIQEMRAFQQTVQAYAQITVSPATLQHGPRQGSSPRVNKSPTAQIQIQNNQTASTAESVCEAQGEIIPSFLKALFIQSDETIFDEDEITQGNSYSNLGLKSLTNSAEGAFSAPDALRMKMQEISRSKSALSSTQPIAN